MAEVLARSLRTSLSWWVLASIGQDLQASKSTDKALEEIKQRR
jgi:prefoldin subunit 5